MKLKITQNKIQKLLQTGDIDKLNEQVRVSLFMQMLGYNTEQIEETIYLDYDGNPSTKLKCYKEIRKIQKYQNPNYQGIQRYLDRLDERNDIIDIEDDIPDEH